MNNFDLVINTFIIIIFPILCYLFYIVANKNIDAKRKILVLHFTLISICYLVYKHFSNNNLYYLLITIPIFISYKKNYKLLYLFLLFNGIIIYYITNIFYVLFFVVEHFLVMVLNKNKKVINHIIIVLIVNSIYFIIYKNNNLIDNIIYMLLYIFIEEIVLYTIVQGEDIINYNIEYKKLKNEEELRKSLFKITHEIKNPLAVCKAYVDIFDYDDKECSKKYIPIISGEIDKILLLLQDFLLVNKANIKFDIVDVNLLLEDINTSIKEIYHLNIDLNSDDDEEIFINGDYNRLTQVLTNLIKNGYEANANKVLVKSYLESKNVIIDVIDNGDGISKNDSTKIYEPFYTTKKDGTGLGVPLSKEIIEAHNGTLNYYSNNKKGTIARISIPIYEI